MEREKIMMALCLILNAFPLDQWDFRGIDTLGINFQEKHHVNSSGKKQYL